MRRYKLAVSWADGTYEGFIGVGPDEDAARCHALQQVFDASMTHNVGFKVIPPADVFFLPKKAKDGIEEQWEDEQRKLDRW